MPQTTAVPQVETIPRPTITTDYVVADETELEKPYRVIIQNDDITPMEFVVLVLRVVFQLASPQAQRIMNEAHLTGRAVVARLPYSEARDRVYAAQHLARESGYPLSFYLEPEE